METVSDWSSNVIRQGNSRRRQTSLDEHRIPSMEILEVSSMMAGIAIRTKIFSHETILCHRAGDEVQRFLNGSCGTPRRVRHHTKREALESRIQRF
jgi:hypothetical protein